LGARSGGSRQGLGWTQFASVGRALAFVH
jgi:hypothetical protein